MGELIQFRPRSNQKADRAFWIGPDPLEVNQCMPDTEPSEYTAPDEDAS